MIESEMLAMVISEMVFEMFGFGPSKSICEPFAQAVIAEAQAVNYPLELP
jgi:hypothetical protein